MKKLVNLIALVVLVSTNVFTPFSYAQDVLPEVIPENEMENVVEDGEIPEISEETPDLDPEEKGEIEQEKQEDETAEKVLSDVQDDIETPVTDETEKEDTESNEVDQPVEETLENEIQDEDLQGDEVGDDFLLQKEDETIVIQVQSGTTATLLPGQQFNQTTKRLAGNSNATYSTSNTTINQIIQWTGDTIPSGVTMTGISTSDSEKEVVAWYDSGIIYYYTEAETIYMNPNSREMFSLMYGLEILEINNWDASKVTDMQAMFWHCEKLKSLNLRGWNTSNVTNMRSMFGYCKDLINLDISGWDTSQVTTMYQMFLYCGNLTELDVSNWNTNKVTNMYSMFSNCSSLISLDVSNWNTSSVTNMSYMFSNCSSLISLDVSNWNTSSVTNMSYMFQNCSSLTGLDVSNWNTSSVTNMSYMFYYCKSLISLDVSNWNTSSVTNMSYMFQNCSSLTSLDVSNWNTSNVTNMGYMFCYCKSLSSLDISNWNTSSVTNMSYMFQYCSNLETIYSGIGFAVSTSAYKMFDGCTKLIGGNGTKYNSSYSNETYAKIDNQSQSGYFTALEGDLLVKFVVGTGDYEAQIVQYGGKVMRPNIDPTREGSEFKGWVTKDGNEYDFNTIVDRYTEIYARFSGDTAVLISGQKINSILMKLSKNFSYPNTEIVHILPWTGEMPIGVTTETISEPYSDNNVVAWYDSGTVYYHTDAKKIYMNPDSSNMFYYLQGLTELDISSWDASKVTDMSYMFYFCNNLTNLDVSNWDTSNVTNMYGMFEYCKSLTQLDLGGWDTSNVTDMYDIFGYCDKLEDLNLSGWNFKKLNDDFRYRGEGVLSYSAYKSPIKKLDMTNTTFSGSMHRAFNRFSTLQEVRLEGADTSNVTDMSEMFWGCSNLKSLNLSGWNTSNVTTMDYMFYKCGDLTELNISDFDTSKVKDMSYMFAYCGGLTGVDLGNWNTSSVTDMGGMFYGCSGLINLDLSSFDVRGLTSSSSMIYGCSSLENLNLSGWDFRNRYSNSIRDRLGLYDARDALKKLDLTNAKFSGSMNSSFYDMNKLEKIILDGVDTSNVTDMGYMFARCSSLTGLDLGSFNTSKVTSMNEMFYNTPSLKTIYVSDKFVTTELTGYYSSGSYMFYNSISIVGGNGTKFDSGYTDKTYAKIDKVGQTGYFTDKNAINVKFINTLDGTETLTTFAKGQKLTPPYVDKYHVAGGYLDEAMTQAIDLNKGVDAYSVIYVKYERNGSSGGGGGGGSSKDTDKDTHGSAEDSQKNTQDDKNTENVIQSDPEHSEWGSEESSNTPMDSSDKSSEGQEILSPSDSSFTKEQKDAYTFAKENGITTKDTIQSAQMNGKLTRIAMAKMLSQYAINVLGQTPDTSKTVKFKDVSNKKDADYDNGVTLAYQLGIMGQNMPGNKFRPNDEVSRAEFATALSRLLYQTTDGEYKSTKEYYIPHMAKLYNEGIISNIDPSMSERRGYVMIMLMRSAK